MMLIEVGKQYYNREGEIFTIISDLNDTFQNVNYCFVGVNPSLNKFLRFKEDGRYLNSEMFNDDYDLVKIVSKYDHFNIDDPVYIPSTNTLGHFAGISDNGKPMIWLDGCTSWTSTQSIEVEHVITKDEYEE